MSNKKKKALAKGKGKKVSKAKKQNKVIKNNKNFIATTEKIGVTVVLIYWNVIKWFFILLIRGTRTILSKKSIVVKHRPKLSTYRSLFGWAIKLIKKFFQLILFPFKIILYPFKPFIWIIKKIYAFEIRFRLLSCQFIFLILFLGVAYIISLFYLTILKDLPSGETLYQHDPNLTTRIYDRKGNLLYRLYFNEDRIPVSLSEIPQDLVDATVAVEDEEFFNHNGLSYRGIIRAAKSTFLEDDLEGGSTITQQLVKNLLLTPERTYERKLKEALLAIEVERRFSKEQILEMYLNNISFGGTSYGVKSASKKYFGKELDELSLAESAYLAGIPNKPSVYSPFSSTPELGKNRQIQVLNRMVLAGFISRDEADKAMAEELSFIDANSYIRYPHFVNYIIDELNKEYGQMFVAKGGLEVYTSIDPELQTAAEEIVFKQVERLSRYQVKNGSVLITDPETGEILAMVGSANYWDESNDGNVNITTSNRQPGSSIKPLAYAIAIEQGSTPYTLIKDEPVEYRLSNGDVYKPVNYNGRFHGTMPLKSALANSYNIPAVKLADQLGVSTIVDWAPKFGITTWNEPQRYGLSITLGAAEVKMTDMAVLYGTFANGGYKKELDPILKIYDAYGNTVHENTCVSFDSSEDINILTRRFEFRNDRSFGDTSGIKPLCKKDQVISERTAYYITDMLSDNRARTPAFGSNSNLNIKNKQVAVKTGTTTSVRDNWAVGYTGEYVVVSWIGNNDNSKMGRVVSGTANSASGIWRDTFDYLIDNRNIADNIDITPNMVDVYICPLTNTLSCGACSGIKQSFVKGDEPTTRCSDQQIRNILGIKDEDSDEENNNEDSKDRDLDYWLN